MQMVMDFHIPANLAGLYLLTRLIAHACHWKKHLSLPKVVQSHVILVTYALQSRQVLDTYPNHVLVD